MKKSILSTSTNNKTFNKKTNPDKKFKLNSKFFSLKFIPYNKILNDLLMYLQKKLSTSLFNEIMKHFINEIKKYLRKNISSNTVSNNISINKNQTEILNRSKNNRVISEFCFKNNNNDKVQSICKNRTKINLKKFILPYFNLSHSHKLKNNFLSTREISSFSNNLNYKNDGSNFSLLDDKDISLILTENNYTVDNIGKKKKIQKNKTNNNSLAKQNQSKNKYSNIFLSNNSNYKTINTTINKNLKNKIFQTDKTKILTKKLKLVNIKLKEKDTKGNVRIISPVQNPNEMLDKIKKSLDDDNLRVMLNFSYENFLSKESERTSKEYSFGD